MLSVSSVLLESHRPRQGASEAVIMRHCEVAKLVLFRKQDHQNEEMVPRLCIGAQDIPGEPDHGRWVCKARTGSRSSDSQPGLLLLHLNVCVWRGRIPILRNQLERWTASLVLSSNAP